MMTFRELQDAIDAWISQFEAGYWPPLVNLEPVITVPEDIRVKAKQALDRMLEVPRD